MRLRHLIDDEAKVLLRALVQVPRDGREIRTGAPPAATCARGWGPLVHIEGRAQLIDVHVTVREKLFLPSWKDKRADCISLCGAL